MYKLDKITNKILIGDCIEELKKIPSDSVNLIFADPPFNLSKKYDSTLDNKIESEYILWCKKWIIECVRILKTDGTLFLHNIPKWLIEYANILNNIGMHFKHWIVWDSMSTPLGKTLLPAHYGILYYTKNKNKFTFNEMRIPHEICKKCGSILKDYGGKKNSLNPFGTLLTDVWKDIHRIKHSSKRDNHPCQLPLQLLERLILIASNENDLVLDPFLGSGTTAIAAIKNKRNYIGIEISTKYSEICKQKISETKPDSSTFFNYIFEAEEQSKYYVPCCTIYKQILNSDIKVFIKNKKNENKSKFWNYKLIMEKKDGK